MAVQEPAVGVDVGVDVDAERAGAIETKGKFSGDTTSRLLVSDDGSQMNRVMSESAAMSMKLAAPIGAPSPSMKSSLVNP